MSTRAPGLSDTIVAVATPPGRGGLAIVRLSGQQATSILLQLSPALEGRPPAPRRQVLLAVGDPHSGETLDRALVSRFVAPASYTGEDTVEIACHGGELTPRMIVDACVAAGARTALPGEFTRRAYLNGRIDLVQAEAVADLIDSRSPAMHRAAVHQMERGLSDRLDRLRENILRAEALAAYSIDFPEEDEPPVPVSDVAAAVHGAHEQIARVLRTAPEGELLRRGPLVVLAGRPNSGKSSLFNALLGVERSIVTEIPGTTRDAVESEVLVEGYPFRFADTAGIRSTSDRVESLGIEVARRYLDAADLVLFCAEAGDSLDAAEHAFLEQHAATPNILVRTKADILSAPGQAVREDEIAVSVVTGDGLDQLRRRLLDLVFGDLIRVGEDQPVIIRERHRNALTVAADELERFLGALDAGIPLDVAATHLRAAAGSIEDIIGVVTPDDVLGAVFGQFCVGK